MIVFDKILICSKDIDRTKRILDNFVPKILWLKNYHYILNYFDKSDEFESSIKNFKNQPV